MKVTMQMLRDLGVCEPALDYLSRWAAARGLTSYDYKLGLEMMLQNVVDGQDWIDENYPGTEHSSYNDWVRWTQELATRPDAIMYHGDHIWTNTYHTEDMLLHESLEAARAHIKRLYGEIRADYSRHKAINAIAPHPSGAETWVQVDNLADADLNGYSEYVWHDTRTGKNCRTTSPTIASVFNAEGNKLIENINLAEENTKIYRKVLDESGEFEAWVEVTND